MLKILYAAFIGILLAIFVGLGIATFYPSPEAPAQDDRIHVEPAETPTPADIEAETASQEAYEEYQAALELYNRNVALIAVTISILILVISLTVANSIPVITEGLLLGGVFTLIYGIGRSFGAGDTRVMFTVVSIGFAVAIVVGYMKFVKPGLAKK